MTRQEIVMKVLDKTAASTTKAMQCLKRKLGRDFNKLFLTVSSDNGCEFADQDGLIISVSRCFTAIRKHHMNAAVTRIIINSCADTFPKGKA